VKGKSEECRRWKMVETSRAAVEALSNVVFPQCPASLNNDSSLCPNIDEP